MTPTFEIWQEAVDYAVKHKMWDRVVVTLIDGKYHLIEKEKNNNGNKKI